VAIRARAHAESEIIDYFKAAGAKNATNYASFLGAGHSQIAVETILGGNHGKEFVNGRGADFGEHLLAFCGRFGKVAHF
jgi:hypothetical protein